MNQNFRNIALWAIIGLLIVAVFQLFSNGAQTQGSTSVPYSKFLSDVDAGRVRAVTIQGQQISGSYTDASTPFQTYAPQDANLIERLEGKNVSITAAPPSDNSNPLWSMILSFGPILLILGVWIFLMRQMQGGAGGKAMGFGKSKAKLLTEAHGRVTFADVAGVDEAKQDLEEIVEFLREPQKFQRLGGKIPRGVLLVGPPGTGKTLLARSVAGEANVPFFTISGSDFVEMFVGVGASRVRDMFEQAKKNSPCIIFIDEIDAVGRHRGAGLGGGNDEREQTLNQLLVEMDGFEPNEGIIIIAATNRPDVLDPALLRPGRFDRQVMVSNPDVGGREKILKVHVRNVPLAPNVDLRTIARGTPGFSGADLANLVNEAALMAARRSKRLVTMLEFEDAKDKVMMGAERRSMAMTEDEKALTAYHEAGHALVGIHEPFNDPLHKVTIIPRGRALGVTMNLPERDRYGMRKNEMEARLAMIFGGRAAEEIIYGLDNVTTGASNDIQQATNMARAMVMEYGMSEKLGRLRYRQNQEEVFLGHSVSQQQNMSEDTSRMIDSEVRGIIEAAENKARKILNDHIDELHIVAKGLLEFETLSGDEVRDLIAGKTLARDMGDDTPPSRGSAVPKTGSSPRPKGAPDSPLEPQPSI
ncbi:ATP-dependent zinc metalloprotease FtsH [Aureimonas glaciei]|jgi:cell division protease FtsH|uniref:ATP-dependent zinc metalloprotease FtsH n=1 Tax=Aureimonas glaciei TaxID=1776957 RepID=A0A916XUD8_9HYPH|nr:ATP-dependent zinc metalloprotease FtsH [Aureimonas glaciei]GGD09580.1 ATP-dependent zinc metalloprotease FtsH [Aureimonas glaciei]